MRLVTQTRFTADALGDLECIRMLKRAGFDGIDWSFPKTIEESSTVLFSSSWKEHALEMKAVADEVGIEFAQAHATYPSSTGAQPYDTVITDRLIRAMECCSLWCVKNLVIHPVQHLTYSRHVQELFDMNVKFYKDLIPHAERLGVRICTENMWQYDAQRGHIADSVCADPKEFCALIDAVNSPYLVACLDVGHSALVGYDVPDFIRALGKERLQALHIHDVDYRNDCHTLPFMQKLPWEDILSALAEIGYEGDFTYEANCFLQNLPAELMEPACTFMAQTGRYLISRIEAHRQ